MGEMDTGTPELKATYRDGIATLTLNRPDNGNALTQTLVSALGDALAVIAADEEVAAVVLTGAGSAFCDGADVTWTPDGTPFDARLINQRNLQRATALALWEIPKPTVAIINGEVGGAGLAIALACDLRYAADDAVFTTGFAKAGLSGDFGGSWFLTQLVGTAKARELYYFAEKLDATEAKALGLVNAVFPAAELSDSALGKVRQLVAGPRLALRYQKENLNRAATRHLADVLDSEIVLHLRTVDTDDHREATSAYLANREPNFVGK